MFDVPRSLQSWVATIQTVVLTAGVFQLFIKIFYKKLKTSAVSTTDWMVDTQLCKLRGTSDTSLDVLILFFIFYAKLPVLLYLLHSMLGVSQAVQDEKKLWKFTQSDTWGIGARSTGGGVLDSIQQLYV